MQKNTLHSLFTFLLFCNSFLFAQEINIKGVIKNNNNVAIERASVVLFDANESAIAYTFTNEEGFFGLSFQKKQTTYKLVVSSLGFQKGTVFLDTTKNNIELSISLVDKVENLNEVILAVVKTSDTTKIKAQEYINDTEQTVEDLLKKLPGIEVQDDGTIKAYGKTIDKLLIEGDDVLNKNYKLLSKNLDAKVVDEVQILTNFEDNPVLKRLFESEKVALNLKLKKDKHNIWFGNINLGAGVFSENRWKEGLNIGLLRKKIKLFYFADYNNLGEKATDILTDNIYEDNTYGVDRYERKSSHYFGISSNENTSFRRIQQCSRNLSSRAQNIGT